MGSDLHECILSSLPTSGWESHARMVGVREMFFPRWDKTLGKSLPCEKRSFYGGYSHCTSLQRFFPASARALLFFLSSSPWEPCGASGGETHEGMGGPLRQYPQVFLTLRTLHAQPKAIHQSHLVRVPVYGSSSFSRNQQISLRLSGFTWVSSLAGTVRSATSISEASMKMWLILFVSCFVVIVRMGVTSTFFTCWNWEASNLILKTRFFFFLFF